MLDRIRPFLGATAVISALTLFCGIFLLVFGQTSSVSCSRPEPSLVWCTRTTLLFGVIPFGSEELRDIDYAYVEESCDDGCTYRVVFATASGDVPLTIYSSSGSSYKSQQVEQINIFLQDREQQTLELHGDRSGLYIVCGIPLAFGAMIGLFWLFGRWFG